MQWSLKHIENEIFQPAEPVAPKWPLNGENKSRLSRTNEAGFSIKGIPP